ncbi:molecular chaperone [Providencia alcalifaciens]|uniref:fimbrial biogenesis chaperone n=1 Tax=Providencia alcalifaciens TaxID=126385 RepID=UPI00249F2043|nr:molecular chaperone [Providencia alcalifaciens]WGZ55773.1 molecular chaperone [Providencia alcalifaciens]
MRHNRFMQGICSGLLLLSASSLAGVAIDATRIIFSVSDNTTGKSVGITSSSQSATPYLIKAQILQTPYGDNGETPFVVTPSLFRLEPGSTNQVRIMKKNGALPQNKESVFYFRTVAMPTSEKGLNTPQNNIDGAVQVSTGNVIKLFYRPDNLGMTQPQAMKSLTFSSVNNGVKVTNPSPYYITLDSLKIANKSVPLSATAGNNMIAPFGSVTYSHVQRQGTVEWKAINDYGGKDEFHAQIH